VKNPDSIKKVKNINFDFDSIASAVILDEVKYPLESWADTPYGTIKFVANRNYIVPGEKKPLHFSLIPPQELSSTLLKNLSVTASSKLSTIINLRFKDEVPKRAEDILNEMVILYSH